jgi:hypothetical protein
MLVPYGMSIFCDDLRPEEGGKVSFMGVYRTDIILNGEFPSTLPKFVIYVFYFEPKDCADEELTIKSFLPGDDPEKPSFETRLPKDFRQHTATNPNIGDDEEGIRGIHLPVVVGNLVLKQKGWIMVRAVCGKVTTKLGTLWVDHKSLPPPPPPQ